LFVGFGSTQFAQFAQFDRDVYKCVKSKRAKCAKRRERRRGSEKKETTTKSENEDETDAAPAGYDRAARARALARAEAAYIVQSFVSKTLLGWLTYAGNFA
jgi:hypothetical protein